jgi:hypothetical protein
MCGCLGAPFHLEQISTSSQAGGGCGFARGIFDILMQGLVVFDSSGK